MAKVDLIKTLVSRAARLIILLGGSLLLLALLPIIGALLPSIPYLGAIGSLLLGLLAPWFVLISLLGLAANLWRWRKNGDRGAKLLSIVVAFALIGSTIIYGRQIAAAQASGVSIDLAQTLSLNFIVGGNPPDAEETYASFEDQALNVGIYRPKASANELGERRLAPVLLYVHGGGWVSGGADNRAKDLRWFADRGWLVLTIDYTLATPDRPMWDKQTGQIGCAMAWAGANAARYGGDPARIAMTGESAGGNLVINASYLGNRGKLRSPCGGVIPKISGVSAVYPAVDPADMFASRDALNGENNRTMLRAYVGGSPSQFPDRYAAIKSATHINPKAPPTLIIVAESDHLVAPEPSYTFAKQASAAGIETQLIRIPHADHAFDMADGSVGDQLFRQATQNFLRRHFEAKKAYLNKPPSSPRSSDLPKLPAT